MKTSWILAAATLCAQAYSADPQMLGLLDLVGSMSKCTNGNKPTFTCVSPSAEPTCVCNCSDGGTFNTTLPPNLANIRPTYASDSSNDRFEADKASLAAREEQLQQQLSNQQHTCDVELNKLKQEHAEREQALLQKQQQLADEVAALRPKSWKYLGCYSDGDNRVLKDRISTDDQMTREKCAHICRDFRYYGVQYGRECYCGNAFAQSTSKLNDSECNVKCGGSSDKCGAGHKNSLFEKQT